jgi:pimeloyl-ACP methyl ester carboxylesterase
MRTDRFVEVMGYRIRCRAEGSGPPLILIHGIGASLEYWNWTIPALRDHYTTIAFDVPGFGQSDPIEWANTPNGAAKAVLELMDALGIRTAVLVGSSLGGGIATMVAGSAPERVTALVLAAPAGFGVRVNPLLRVSTLPWLGEGLLALAARNPYLALRDVFADQRRIPNGLIEIFRRDAARPVTGQTYLKTLRTSVTLRGIRPEIVRHMRTAAAQISAPTLIVWGTKDRIIPSDQAPVAARTIPGARLQMMTGLGHVPYLEAPDAFNTVLAAFLFDVARPVEAPAAR